MRLAFLLDLGLYYFGVASQPFKRGVKGLTEPVFSTPPSTPFFYFMRTYNPAFREHCPRATGKKMLRPDQTTAIGLCLAGSPFRPPAPSQS